MGGSKSCRDGLLDLRPVTTIARCREEGLDDVS